MTPKQRKKLLLLLRRPKSSQELAMLARMIQCAERFVNRAVAQEPA